MAEQNTYYQNRYRQDSYSEDYDDTWTYSSYSQYGSRRGSSQDDIQVISFRNLSEDVALENIDIPESPENRRPTNVNWLILLVVAILLTLPYTIYTLYYSDISRISVGYDKCGNVCGKKNYKWEGISCSGQDFTNYPYLQLEHRNVSKGDGSYYTIQENRCVQSCKEGYTAIAIFGKCRLNTQKDVVMFEIFMYFSSVKWQLTISCLLSILVAMGMLFLFRSSAAFMVWGILIGTLLVSIVSTAGLLYFADIYDTSDKYAVSGTFFMLVAFGLAILIVLFLKKIPLIILLLKETTKAVFDMPGLIAVLVISELAILGLISVFFITSLCMLSAGTLQKTMSESYTYVVNPITLFALLYNGFVCVWLTQFLFGIQYIIIAGAVAKWYFARDKSYLGSPIVTSMANAFKFHLGTVAMGSLIITIIRHLCSRSNNERGRHGRRFFSGCGDLFVELAQYLTKNAYIVTAIHGQPFLKSGKRAAKLLIKNFGDMVALNIISYAVLGIAMCLIVIISVLLSIGVFAVAPGPYRAWVVYLFVAVFAFVFAFIAFGVFETGIDAIFICYCEDKLLNDGVARPYFMSENLVKFIKKSKEVYRITNV